MRIFALSDVHVDYDANVRWVGNLSLSDYKDDVLIVAGDVSDVLTQLDWCLRTLVRRFRQVLFVPGNHDLWVMRDDGHNDSIAKYFRVCRVVEQSGASSSEFHHRNLSIIPLLGWYDYSFGTPGEELRRIWVDFRACRWPQAWEPGDVTSYFLALNNCMPPTTGTKVISFSHFLPRIDLMPSFIPIDKRLLYPVLGTSLLEAQVRKLRSDIHVYGHSHVNRQVQLDGTMYVNNALAYPYETRIASRSLKCIYETS